MPLRIKGGPLVWPTRQLSTQMLGMQEGQASAGNSRGVVSTRLRGGTRGWASRKRIKPKEIVEKPFGVDMAADTWSGPSLDSILREAVCTVFDSPSTSQLTGSP